MSGTTLCKISIKKISKIQNETAREKKRDKELQSRQKLAIVSPSLLIYTLNIN